MFCFPQFPVHFIASILHLNNYSGLSEWLVEVHEDVLAGVSQVSGEDLNALVVNLVCAVKVVLSLDVWELVCQTLSVQVLL